MHHSKQKYILCELIGKGCSSKVYRGYVNDQEQAIKFFLWTVSNETVKKEIDSFNEIEHENILKRTSSDDSKNPKWLGTELCKFDLTDIVIKTGSIPSIYSRFIVLKMCNALQYLHEKGFVHRDIKPENILFDDCFNPKLCDLGFLTLYKSDQTVIRYQGTKGYMAPELQTGESTINAQELKASDMFSLGVLIFVMICGKMPIEYNVLKENPPLKLIQQKKWDSFWKSQSQAFEEPFKEMIQGLLAFDSRERWTLEKLMECDWMNQATPCQSEFQNFMKQKAYQLTQKTSQR